MDNKSTTAQSARRPVKVNGYSNYTSNAKRKRKRQEAEARQAAHDKLTLKQKLDQAVGIKERTKLQKKIDTQKQAKEKQAPLSPDQKLDKTVKHAQALVQALPKHKSKK